MKITEAESIAFNEERDESGVALYYQQFFSYDHLPKELQVVSRAFAEVAREMRELHYEGPEYIQGIRHLLAAKDCFVRHTLAEGFKKNEGTEEVS